MLRGLIILANALIISYDLCAVEGNPCPRVRYLLNEARRDAILTGFLCTMNVTQEQEQEQEQQQEQQQLITSRPQYYRRRENESITLRTGRNSYKDRVVTIIMTAWIPSGYKQQLQQFPYSVLILKKKGGSARVHVYTYRIRLELVRVSC